MFRIGEFSKLTQVSIRMLRYYDEVGLLKPAEVDKWTGHRSYSVDQIPRLNKILYLRDSGLNVSEIELAKNEIQGGKGVFHYNISVKSIPAYQVLSLRRIVPTYYSEADLWSEISSFASKQKIEIESDTFSIYHDTDFKEQNVDIELCVPVKKTGKSTEPFRFRMTEPVPTMACTMVYGEFSNIKGVYLGFAEWLQENSQYRMANPMRQIVHRGPWNENTPEKYLIEIQMPLERA